MEYETLLIGFGWWVANDSTKFPRFMLIAEEAEGEEKAGADVAADGVSGVTVTVASLEPALQLETDESYVLCGAQPARLFAAL